MFATIITLFATIITIFATTITIFATIITIFATTIKGRHNQKYFCFMRSLFPNIHVSNMEWLPPSSMVRIYSDFHLETQVLYYTKDNYSIFV